MDGEGSVVRFDDGVGHLRGRADGEGLHDSVRVFLADLGDEQSTHAGAGSSAEGVGDLESLEAIAAFSFLSDDVEDGVDEFCTFGVVTLSPVVACAGLSEDEVVGSEELSEWSCADGVHGSGFEVHQDCARDLASAGCLVVVDVDSLELQVGITALGSGWVNTVFVRDNFPEFGTNLVSALSSLNVYDFSHN